MDRPIIVPVCGESIKKFQVIQEVRQICDKYLGQDFEILRDLRNKKVDPSGSRDSLELFQRFHIQYPSWYEMPRLIYLGKSLHSESLKTLNNLASKLLHADSSIFEYLASLEFAKKRYGLNTWKKVFSKFPKDPMWDNQVQFATEGSKFNKYIPILLVPCDGMTDFDLNSIRLPAPLSQRHLQHVFGRKRSKNKIILSTYYDENDTLLRLYRNAKYQPDVIFEPIDWSHYAISTSESPKTTQLRPIHLTLCNCVIHLEGKIIISDKANDHSLKLFLRRIPLIILEEVFSKGETIPAYIEGRPNDDFLSLFFFACEVETGGLKVKLDLHKFNGYDVRYDKVTLLGKIKAGLSLTSPPFTNDKNLKIWIAEKGSLKTTLIRVLKNKYKIWFGLEESQVNKLFVDSDDMQVDPGVNFERYYWEHLNEKYPNIEERTSDYLFWDFINEYKSKARPKFIQVLGDFNYYLPKIVMLHSPGELGYLNLNLSYQYYESNFCNLIDSRENRGGHDYQMLLKELYNYMNVSLPTQTIGTMLLNELGWYMAQREKKGLTMVTYSIDVLKNPEKPNDFTTIGEVYGLAASKLERVPMTLRYFKGLNGRFPTITLERDLSLYFAPISYRLNEHELINCERRVRGCLK